MDIFSKGETIISDIMNRLLNCRNTNCLYVFGNPGKELDFLYPAVKIETVKEPEKLTGIVSYISISAHDDLEKAVPWIMENKESKDFVIYVPRELELHCRDLKVFGASHSLDRYSGLQGELYMVGVSFQFPSGLVVPDNFKVLAIMHFYNEADIIERTIQYLLDQELDIYLLDNWSDDGSFEIAQKYKEAYPDRIYLDRFPLSGKSVNYEWYTQLEKTEMLSKELDYEWFIHYDTDEMRVSPWKGVTLRRAIYWIDRQGYNCIENTVIDFRITGQDADNLFMKDTFFDFRHRNIWIDQLKTWKKSGQIELKSSGGHFAHVNAPKIYPLKFLNRHYPLRSIAQAEKKVFCDRLPRFRKEKKQRGWHGQYDRMRNIEDFLFEPSQLLLWEKDTFDKLYIPLFLECGVRKDDKNLKLQLPVIEGKRILLYGAGRLGKRVYFKVVEKNTIVGWADQEYKRMPMVYCEKIISPREIKNRLFDYVIIAVQKQDKQKKISAQMQQLGVPEKKICYIEIITERVVAKRC